MEGRFIGSETQLIPRRGTGTRLTSCEAFVKTRTVSRRNWIFAGIFFAAVAVRLIGIDQPFIDQWSWRQSDVAAIARNFYTKGFRFAWPQIDWAGDAAGYVGTEFPALPFVAALCYRIAGLHEWIGRIQAVLFFAASLPFLFLLIRDLFGERTALWSAFFYSFAPLSVAASRAFMPDIPSLSLGIIGSWLYLRWLNTGGVRLFISAAVTIGLSLLIKLPTALIGAMLLYLTVAAVYDRRDDAFGGHTPPLQMVGVFGAIALLPSAMWYWHAHEIAERYYPHHMFGAGGFTLEPVSWYARIAKQTVLSSLTPVLAALALLGAFVAPAGKFRRAFHWWAAVMLVFVVVAGWGNRHQWYQLPFVPIAAVFAGCACEWIRARTGAAVPAVVAVAFALMAFFAARPFFAPAAAPLRELGLALKEIAPPGSLVIAADDGDPTIFYYAERKGWHFLEKEGVFYGNPLDDAQLITEYDSLRARGASYIVFSFGTRWWLDYYKDFARHLSTTAALVRNDPNFVIYRITATRL